MKPSEMTDEELTRAVAEEWRRIPNYSGYEVSNFGRVRSWRHKNGLRKQPYYLKLNDINRYYMVQLHINGICYPKLVHHLVLSAFISPKPMNMEACHNDGNGYNNFIGNLRWDTRKNNHADKELHGTAQRGSKANHSKLSETIVIEIRNHYELGDDSLATMAQIYGVDKSTIWKIIRRKSWRHI